LNSLPDEFGSARHGLLLFVRLAREQERRWDFDWSGRPDLNRRPHAPQAFPALPRRYRCISLNMHKTPVAQGFSLFRACCRSAIERYRIGSRGVTKMVTKIGPLPPP